MTGLRSVVRKLRKNERYKVDPSMRAFCKPPATRQSRSHCGILIATCLVFKYQGHSGMVVAHGAMI